MLNKNGLKTAQSFAKDVLGVVGPFVAAKLLLGKTPVNKHVVTYSDAISAILNSSMLGGDKAEAVSALQMNLNPEFYKAIIDVVKSSMISDDKLDTILKLCNQVGEA